MVPSPHFPPKTYRASRSSRVQYKLAGSVVQRGHISLAQHRASHPNSEVKQVRAGVVLRWGNTRRPCCAFCTPSFKQRLNKRGGVVACVICRTGGNTTTGSSLQRARGHNKRAPPKEGGGAAATERRGGEGLLEVHGHRHRHPNVASV